MEIRIFYRNLDLSAYFKMAISVSWLNHLEVFSPHRERNVFVDAKIMSLFSEKEHA
jgi:hypothetical protein